MSEAFRSDFEEIDPVVVDRNYLTSANVRARFALNNYAHQPIDLEELAVTSLGLTHSHQALYDIGAADGKFLYRLREEFHNEGRLVGVEPNSSQYEMHKLWQTPVEMKLIKRALETQVGRSSSEQVLQKASHLAINPLGIELYEGRAHDLALLESSSADNLFAMFMMYHLTTEQREQAFSEFKRVLKPDGNIIIATSGASNKKRHREFEAAIGKALSIQPPRPMNVGFTTEKATEEVPRYFKNVYVYCQNTSMIIGRSEESIQAYYDSIRSLRDQFEPIPSEEDFNEALYSEVDPAIYQAIIKDGVFTDTIQRSLIIASDDELNDAKLVENGFKKLV